MPFRRSHPQALTRHPHYIFIIQKVNSIAQRFATYIHSLLLPRPSCTHVYIQKHLPVVIIVSSYHPPSPSCAHVPPTSCGDAHPYMCLKQQMRTRNSSVPANPIQMQPSHISFSYTAYTCTYSEVNILCHACIVIHVSFWVEFFLAVCIPIPLPWFHLGPALKGA